MSSETAFPCFLVVANSERQRKKFIVSQKAEMSRNTRRESLTHQGDGMFSVCPTFMRRGSTLGFAAIKAASFTLYLAAMEVNVSPDWTVWTRARAGAGEAGRDGVSPERAPGFKAGSGAAGLGGVLPGTPLRVVSCICNASSWRFNNRFSAVSRSRSRCIP